MSLNHSGLQVLHLPPISPVTRQVDGQRTQIFDAFRNKYVALTPEEWVRQHVLSYLQNELGYPKNKLAVELALRVNGLYKRADIVVYDRNMLPWMLVECKAAEVEINQAVFDQAARYNLSMKVPYLIVTNGLRLLAAHIDIEKKKIIPLKQMPEYLDL